MSRTFPGSGTSDYLEIASDILGDAGPWTMFAWANPDTVPQNGVVCGVYDSGTNNKWAQMRHEATNGTLLAETRNGTFASAETVNTFNAGAWNSCLGIWAALDDRTSILNGDTANKGTNATSKAAFTRSRFRVGLTGDSTVDTSFDGRLAYVTLWDAALTEAEGLALNAGANPTWIRPNSLIECWPIFGAHSPEIGIVGGNTLTVNGTLTTSGEAPPVAALGRFVTIQGVVSAPAGGMTAGTLGLTGVGI